MHFEFHRMRSQKSFTPIKPRLPAGGSLIVALKKTMQRIVSGGRQASSFTLIEPLIVTPQRKLLRSFQRGKSASSFTLIELLIVIGILAVLVAAVVVVLNPAQLLAQARDSKRQQDLSALNQALNTVYALDQTISFGTSSIVYTSLPDSSSTCGSWGLPTLPSGWSYHCSPTTTLQQTNGTGWIPVNFNTTGAVSLASLPLDPQNTSSTGLYYTYVTGGSYELTAAFESTKYKMGGDGDKASTDGGSYPDLYEQGSNLSLQPIDHGDLSLVGYWPLNEGTGTIAYDRSGNNNNGTWNGTPSGDNGTFYAVSNGKTVGYFDGMDNYVNALSSSTMNTITQEMTIVGQINPFSAPLWLNNAGCQNGFVIFGRNKATYTAPYRIIYFQLGGGNGAWYPAALFGHLDGTSDGGVCTDGYSTSTFPNIWTFFATTFSLSQGADVFYINGSVMRSFTNSGKTIMTDNTPGLIGGGISGGTDMDGLISNVRIYNRALSASEIQALYNATK